MTNKKPSALYGTIRIRTHKDESVDRETWLADLHRTIHLESAVDRDTKARYDRQELRAAFHWCAGVLARASIGLAYAIDSRNRYEVSHQCMPWSQQNPDGLECGIGLEEGITTRYSGPRWAVDEEGVVPEVWLNVPTADADYWLDTARTYLASLLADDLKPLPSLDVEPGHTGLTLAQPTTVEEQPR